MEAFACGTAAVLTPIGTLKAADFTIDMPTPEDGVALALRRALTDIQYGRAEDRHGWMMRLDAEASE